MGVTASIIGAVAAVGGTGYSISKQEQAARDGRAAATKVTTDAQQQQKDAETKVLAAGRDAQTQTKQRAAAADGPFGQSGTILTGPQGVTNPIVPGKKTLLGA